MLEYTVTEVESAPNSGEVANFFLLVLLCMVRHTFLGGHALTSTEIDTLLLRRSLLIICRDIS
jgi:hypothetical protein